MVAAAAVTGLHRMAGAGAGVGTAAAAAAAAVESRSHVGVCTENAAAAVMRF